MRSIFLSVLIIAFLVSGCSSSPKTITSTLPVTKDEWTVKMTHSGGIMGLRRSVEVLSDGSYTIIDERASQTITGKLFDNELTSLREVIAGSEYVAMEKSSASMCADCFVYDLEIQGGGKKFIVKLDDTTLPESGMETLVMFLRGLIDSALR